MKGTDMSIESDASFAAHLKDVEKVKELVGQSSSEDQLRGLLDTNFSYFHISWDESPEAQRDGDDIANICGGIDMFKNANDKWIIVSIDPNAHF